MTVSRSLVHMLNVFAERLDNDHGPTDVVKAIKLLAKDRTSRRAVHRDWNKQEELRIERQRADFAKARSGVVIRDLLLQRAYDLLWDGDCLGCDALLEFVPSADADKLLSAWSADEEGKEPKSKWYGEKAA